MSMGIDLNKPLTPEERAYLNERGQTAVIERVDALHGVQDDTVFEGDGTGPRTNQLMTGLAVIERPEVLVKQLEDMGYKVTIEEINPAGADEEDDEELLPPYEQWKVPELDKELKARDLPVTGDKAAKAAALRADDARLGAEQ
jgi:hypothetical protein